MQYTDEYLQHKKLLIKSHKIYMAANGLINSKILINSESPTAFAIFKIFSAILKRRVINCALL